MIKGCRREMVFLETRESEIFESAWLVLRRERGEYAKVDMIAEANRIIGVAGEKKSHGSPFWRRMVPCSVGFLIGSALSLLLMLLIG